MRCICYKIVYNASNQRSKCLISLKLSLNGWCTLISLYIRQIVGINNNTKEL